MIDLERLGRLASAGDEEAERLWKREMARRGDPDVGPEATCEHFPHDAVTYAEWKKMVKWFGVNNAWGFVDVAKGAGLSPFRYDEQVIDDAIRRSGRIDHISGMW